MKRLLILIVALFMYSAMGAQTADVKQISVNALIEDEQIPPEAAHVLHQKMKLALTQNGIADYGYSERFVLAAIVSVTQKDIIPTLPSRLSQKIELTFLFGDILENKLIDSYSLQINGVGVTETKSFISAFQHFSPNDKGLQGMLSNAKLKIVDFYSKECESIIANANTMASTGRFDEAIFRLMSVPDVCHECFTRCRSVAVSLYQDKLAHDTSVSLELAKMKWIANPNSSGAAEVAEILSQVNPNSSNYEEVVAFYNEVAEKLDVDTKRELEMEMKKYEDSKAFKMSIIEACESIGVAFGNGQPQSVAKTIVHGWL